MPDYRGIQQADLLKSITDAMALLDKYSPGPACQADVDRLRTADPATGKSPLDLIRDAADNKELASAMRGRGTSVFMFMQPVLAYHALQNTDGTGLETYKRLNDWSAMSGARMMAYTQQDGEMDSFLAAGYARKLSQKLPVVTGLKNIFKAAVMMGGEGYSGARQINRLARMARAGADDAQLKAEFLKLDISIRHNTVDAGALACNMHPRQKNALPQAECMGRYGLEIPELTEKKLNWTSPEVKAKADEVYKVLAPYYDTDEVGMTGIGCITSEIPGPQGIMFESTRHAAAAVAAAFPGAKVLDYDGKPVAPGATYTSGLSAPVTVGKPIKFDPPKIS